MSEDLNFLDQCLAGKATPDQIDDFIDRWHEAPGGRELDDFLGMTSEEYSLWLRVPDALPCIIKARLDAIRLADAVLYEYRGLRGDRSIDRTRVARLKEWLKAKGELV
jgi:hypothetical protein